MAYTFDQIFAVDEANTSNVAKDTSVLIFAPGDAAKTPLTITTTDGQPLENPVPINSAGFGPAFMHETLDRVAWEGAGYTGFFTSYDGMKNEASAARSAAGEAAANAATAAADAAASAQAAIDAANLVGAPADAVVADLISNPGTTTGAYQRDNYANVRVVRPGQNLQSALTNGGRVRISGTHAITAQLTIPSNTHLDAEPGAVLDLSGIPDGVPALAAIGTYGTAQALAADLAEGATTMTPTDVTGLAVGDYLKISSNQTFGFTNQPRGEIVRIRSISGGVVTFEDPILDSYAAASDGKFEKASFAESITVEGIKLVGPETVRNIIGLSFTNCRNIKLRGIHSKNLHNTGIQLTDVVESSISDCHLADMKLAGFAVGIPILYACQDITITNCTGARMRHLVATGGGTSRRGISRRIAVSNCTATQMDDAGFDTHPSSEYVSFIGCHVNGSAQDGIIMQSARFIIEGCTVTRAARHGIFVQTVTNRGLDGVISNNRVNGTGSRGISANIDATTAYQVWSGLTVSGNVITEAATGLTVENATTTFSVPGVVVANNTVRRTISAHGIHLRGLTGAVLNGNHVSGSGTTAEGVYLQTCPESVVSGNMIDGNGQSLRCLRLVGAPSSTITGNLFKGATGLGILTDTASGTSVYMGNRNLCTTKGSLSGTGNIQTTADASGAYNL